MDNGQEPDWLQRLRQAAIQRPRTQFDKVRWADLQQLLRERDFLRSQADERTRAALEAMQENHYGRGPFPSR